MTRLTISGVVAAAFAAALFLPATASAASLGVTKPAAADTLIQKVGSKNRRNTTVVDAPTTSVRTNDANTDVDAPFTSVRKSPRGTWIRAPFVNLWVPRR